jgi:hypothetical protein
MNLLCTITKKLCLKRWSETNNKGMSATYSQFSTNHMKIIFFFVGGSTYGNFLILECTFADTKHVHINIFLISYFLSIMTLKHTHTHIHTQIH